MASSQTNPQLVAAIVACAFIMQQLDSTVITTALPQMAVTFHTDPVHLSIAVTSYLLGLAIFIPISGWTADRFGGSRVFRAAIGIFTIGSIFCGLSTNIVELTAARVLQGLGGALMVPVGRLVLFRNVEKAKLVDVMAFLQVPSQLGPLLGPPVGGFITTYASWRWIFLVNVPIGIGGIILAGLYIADHGEIERRPLDWIGFLLSSLSVSGIMIGIEVASRNVSEAMPGIDVLVAGVIVGFFAVRHVGRHPFPILDPSVLHIRTFAVNFWGGSLFRAGTGTLSFLLPLLFQVVFGMSAFVSGLLTVASAAGSMTMRMSARKILRRFGFRSVLIANTLFCTTFLLTCLRFTIGTPSLIILAVLLVGGFILSLQFTSLQVLAYADIGNAQMSSATSIASMVQQLSRGMGIALVAGVLRMAQSLHGTHALTLFDLRIAFVASAVLVLLSLPLYFLLARDAAAEVSGHARPALRSRAK